MLLAAINSSYAQLSVIHDFARNTQVMVINESNDTLKFPFAGGMNSCQFMNMDVNLDGIDDLLVFDRHGYRILPFIVGSGHSMTYHFAPELAASFPPIEHWMQAVDYNHDGKKDIFTYTTGGIKVYRNDSQSSLKFTQVTDPFLLSMQGTTLTNILVTYADYPAIVDIDGDGDYDVLSFWGLGAFVELHKNTSMERFGNADSLTFVKTSSCWGHFAESIEANTITLDTCPNISSLKLLGSTRLDDPKHTGSTLLVNDLNNDGLPDITIGDVDYSTLIHMTNGGTTADARMISQTTDFPNAQQPVDMAIFPVAMLADVNNDGIKDLLIAPFDPSLTKGENFNSSTLYINNGTNAQPVFNLVSKSFLQDQMLDFGSGAYPVLFDYNGDGLMDLLVGNYGYKDTCIYSPQTGLQCTYIAKLALLLNIGTTTKPVFKLVDRNVAHLDSLNMQSLIPALADLDGDGDLDLVLGNSKGKLVYCENFAQPGQAAQFKLVNPAWLSIDVGDYSAPQFYDFDHDGLPDLVCGKRDGTLNYYRNTGTASSPAFTLVSSLFGGVDVTNTQLSNYGYSTPCFYKNPHGETTLFVGSEFGDIYVYDQIDNNLGGNFRLLGSLPGIHEGWHTGVALANINNDTLADLLVGNYSGGLGLFYGTTDKIFGISNPPHKPELFFTVEPNPAANTVSLSFKNESAIKIEQLTIKNIEGKVLRQYQHIDFPMTLDISTFNNGIVILSAQTTKGIATAKLVVCH